MASRETIPLPWIGKLRTREEILEQKPKQDKWLEARKQESRDRIKLLKRGGAFIAKKARKTDEKTIANILVHGYNRS